MNNPKISLILPCYNVAKYLPKCLDSIINQTYINLEIICVNDGSKDNTLDVLNEYKSKDNRIIIIEQENQGLSDARNTGINHATGDYIMFVDSDDWIDVQTCEYATQKFCEHNVDLVFWSYVKEYESTSEIKYIIDDKEKYFNEEETRHLHRRLVGLFDNELSHPENADSFVTAWGKMYKTDIVKNVSFVSTKEIGTEDALFNIYAFIGIKTAYYLPNPFYHYRKDNETSLTNTYKPLLFTQWNHLYDLIEQFLKNNDYQQDFKTAINNRICLSIIGLGLNILEAEKGINKVKEIKRIISSPRYRQAYKQLKLKYFPIHWKVFFAFAKYNCALGLYIMLKAIKMLIGK